MFSGMMEHLVESEDEGSPIPRPPRVVVVTDEEEESSGEGSGRVLATMLPVTPQAAVRTPPPPPAQDQRGSRWGVPGRARARARGRPRHSEDSPWFNARTRAEREANLEARHMLQEELRQEEAEEEVRRAQERRPIGIAHPQPSTSGAGRGLTPPQRSTRGVVQELTPAAIMGVIEESIRGGERVQWYMVPAIGVPARLRARLGREQQARPPSPAPAEEALFDAEGEDETLAVEGFPRRECKICFSRPADRCLLPCRHASLCGPCVRRLQHTDNLTRCPFCNTPFRAVLKLWF